MNLEKALEMPIPKFDTSTRFAVDGAVLIRGSRPDGSRGCVSWNDIRSDVILTQKLVQKMQKAGLDAHHHAVRVKFDRSYTKAQIDIEKLIQDTDGVVFYQLRDERYLDRIALGEEKAERTRFL